MCGPKRRRHHHLDGNSQVLWSGRQCPRDVPRLQDHHVERQERIDRKGKGRIRRREGQVHSWWAQRHVHHGPLPAQVYGLCVTDKIEHFHLQKELPRQSQILSVLNQDKWANRKRESNNPETIWNELNFLIANNMIHNWFDFWSTNRRKKRLKIVFEILHYIINPTLHSN